MFKITIIICIYASILLSNDTKKIDDLTKFISSLDNKTTIEKINSVNFYFNQIVSGYDSLSKVNHDQWDDMIDFIIRGKGDCEEYAISKYELLSRIGIDKNKLFLMIVKEKTRPENEFHLVTAYYESQTNPLILDNLSFRVLPLDRRIDLEPIIIFNDISTYKIDTKGMIKEQINSQFPNQLKSLSKKLDTKLLDLGIFP